MLWYDIEIVEKTKGCVDNSRPLRLRRARPRVRTLVFLLYQKGRDSRIFQAQAAGAGLPPMLPDDLVTGTGNFPPPR
jgi:hypothetical protein